MEPGQILGRASTLEGNRVELRRQASCLTLYVDEALLMSTDAHGSEIAMAGLALRTARAGARVMVGGLGFGYTLRAVLDIVSPDAQVDCVELLAPLARWHRRGPLGPVAGYPLEDPRVTLHIEDVLEFIWLGHDGTFDAILLDVDNGPVPLTTASNHSLYAEGGLERLFALLRPEGHLVVWSAERHGVFRQRMIEAGFDARTELVSAWADDEEAQCDATHALFVGRRPGEAERAGIRGS